MYQRIQPRNHRPAWLIVALSLLAFTACSDSAPKQRHEPTDGGMSAGGRSSGHVGDAEARRDGAPCACEASAGSSVGGNSSDAGPTGNSEAGLGPLGDGGPGVSVSVTPDSKRAVSVDVPTSGGTVSATGADGTTYELTIPPDALLEPTTITLTPASEVGELPEANIAKSHMGVQFGPEGLFFYKPATLLITPGMGAAIPLDQQLFVQWQEDGKNVELAIPDPKSTEMRVYVFHFSGAAVVQKGFDAPLDEVRKAIGGDAEKQWQDAVAEYVTRVRDGENPSGLNALYALLTTELGTFYEDNVIKPRIAAAKTSCAAGRVALQTLVQYGHIRQICGVSDPNKVDPWTARASDIVPDVAEVCMREEYEVCRDQHTLRRILTARGEALRQQEILGVGDPEANGDTLDGYVKKCVHFELDLDSVAALATNSPQCNFALTQTVQTKGLPLSLMGSYADWIAQATQESPGILLNGGSKLLTSLDYQVTASCTSGKDCDKIINVTPEVDSMLNVTSLLVKLGQTGPSFNELVYRPSPNVSSSFQIQDTCADPVYTTPPLSANWWIVYVYVLNNTNPLDQSKGGYVVNGWRAMDQQEVVATKKVFGHAKSSSGDDYSFNDTFTLRHVAQ